MSWFIFAILALLCWSGSDLFSKIGCSEETDKHAHLRMVIAVGAIMGLHALYEIIFGGVSITPQVLLAYLPVSLLYIFSMVLGYVGLRYIELSISSPICNCSGALVAVLCIVMGMADASPLQIVAIALICAGVIGLGIVEATEDDDLRARRQEKSNRKYAKSWLALCLPIAYCLLDALGSFADSLVLADPADPETMDGIPSFLHGLVQGLNEDSANVAYELTFAAAALICLVYLWAKNDLQRPKKAAPRFVGGLFETAGQFAYIYALADTEHVAMSAPIISAYCVASVLWSRLFLKEKLSWKHYIMVFLAIAGIIALGILEGQEA